MTAETPRPKTDRERSSEMQRRWINVLLIASLVFLGSCNQDLSRTEIPMTMPAFLVDADFDDANLRLPSRRVIVDAIELPELENLHIIATPLDTEGDTGLSPQAVLPDATGTVAFIRHNPDLSSNPWMVYLMDQAADVTTLVYGGRREIDSVAVSADGNVLLLAMRRTIDTTSDFEIYRVTLSASEVERLTVTAYDERNVSMSSDASVLVWEGEDEDGQRAVFVREADTEEHLALVLEQREPSVSADGGAIALIRILNNGNHRAVRYDRHANTYQVVWGQPLPVTLSHPSSSDGGAKITILEHRPPGTAPSERQLVRYLDPDAGTVTNAAGVQLSDGPRIAHPHLARDGDHLTYAWRQGDAWNIFTRRISTRETQRVAVSTPPTTNHAPYWQMPSVSPVTKRALYDLTHDSHNYLDPDDPNNYGDAWSLGGWRDLLVADGWQVDKLTTGPVTTSSLQNYDVFVTATPRSAFTSAEITTIGDYVTSGGSVLFIGEYGSQGSITATDATPNPASSEAPNDAEAHDIEPQYQQPGQHLNAVADQFGLTLDLTFAGETITDILSAFHPINAGSSAYGYEDASSVSGGQVVFFSPGYNRIMATASHADGCVALIGDTTIWSDDYGLGRNDNDQLAVNTMDYLLDCPSVSQPTATLTVSKDGVGTGTVTSSPIGIDCGPKCVHEFEAMLDPVFGAPTDIPVTLTVTPDAGSVFTGWSGACSGTDPCTVPVGWIPKSVTATFDVPTTTHSISGNVEYSEVWPSGGPTADATPMDSGWLADGKALMEASGAPPAAAMRDFDSGPAWEVGNWATAKPGVHYMPNEIIVGFRDELFSVRAYDAWTLSANQISVLGAELQATATTFATDHGLSVRSTTPILRVALMRFPSDRELVDVMAQLGSDPRVAYVEPNGISWTQPLEPRLDAPPPRQADAEPAATHPTDPRYVDQAWHYSFVGAQRGWDTQRGSSEVRVAVIDTGYRPDHPDRPYSIADEYDFVDFDPDVSWHYYRYCSDSSITKPRAWDLTGYDDDATEWMSYWFFRNRNCLTGPDPEGSHGMHVIGTIAADWWNTGGVGLNYDVTIIPIQAMDLAGRGTTNDIANAVLYAGGLPSATGVPTITRADIINMSLGSSSKSTTMEGAVVMAYNAGSLIIASAGNAASSDRLYPAAYGEVVAVTAIGGDGTLASYSNYGSWVELTAPGGDFWTEPNLGVWSTTFDYSGCSTTPTEWCHHSGDGEANWTAYNGTSMAAPHVSGIAALYKANDPSLSSWQLRDLLRDLAFDWGTTGFNDEYGYGLAHVRPGLGVRIVTSRNPRRVQLIDADTGATVQEVTTSPAGDYAFTNVPNGSYYVLAASSGSPTWTYGATGASISAYAAADPGWFQGATPVTVSNTDLAGIDIRLGWPEYQGENGTPTTAAFMQPGYYAVITYDHTVPDRWFRIRVPTAGSYRIWTDGVNSPDRCGSGVIGPAANRFGDFDTVIELYESDGTSLIAANDDAPGRGLCSELDQNLTAGTYLLKVRAWGSVSIFNDDRQTILRFDAQ